ncbi:MAG: LD-carboxypeptidase [Bacteroidota bacterium]
MITPQALKAGDTIGIVSTARKITEKELEPAVGLFESWGLKVIFGKNIFHADNQYSGTDAERAADLQQMLDDDSVKAIICARGGYGTVRIIDRIDCTHFMTHPKWIVGYSDVTVLHSHIHTNCGIETIHAMMPVSMNQPGHDKESEESLRKVLFGEKIIYNLPSHPLNRSGKAKGVMVGGNLSLLHTLAGTASDINTDGRILFIEDLDEYLYHIDRMILSLKRCGKLKDLAALIVGGMTEMNDNETPFGKDAYTIIAEAVAEFHYPVIFGFPAGHIGRNLALVMGRKLSLKAGETVEVAFL